MVGYSKRILVPKKRYQYGQVLPLVHKNEICQIKKHASRALGLVITIVSRRINVKLWIWVESDIEVHSINIKILIQMSIGKCRLSMSYHYSLYTTLLHAKGLQCICNNAYNTTLLSYYKNSFVSTKIVISNVLIRVFHQSQLITQALPIRQGSVFPCSTVSLGLVTCFLFCTHAGAWVKTPGSGNCSPCIVCWQSVLNLTWLETCNEKQMSNV